MYEGRVRRSESRPQPTPFKKLLSETKMAIGLSGRIDKDWSHALELWRRRGRTEDLPRNERRPRYVPDAGKVLAQRFASEHKGEFPFLIDRLRSGDKFEKLCAFEVLEMICWQYNVGGVPQELLSLNDPLPLKIASEIQADPEVEMFKGHYHRRVVLCSLWH